MSFALDTGESITQCIDALIEEICPTAGRRAMYGGIIFEKEAGKHSTGVCGHFIYKAHVSLEFSQGTRLTDADGVLEGSGKHRRHLKFRNVAEVEDGRALYFLQQAFALPQD